MKNLETFKFSAKQVRATLINGEPWFVAKDICDCLEVKNPRDAVSKMVDSEDVAICDALRSNGRVDKMTHVNESGMYALIFTSRKDEAKKFKRWVTKEVLPAIRKTGSYGHSEWATARQEGKVIRRDLTDVIQNRLIPMAIEQGSKNSGRLYQVYTKMVKDLLFEFREKVGRDHYNFRQLATLQVAEDVVCKIINNLCDERRYYKDIYKEAKRKIQDYADIVGTTPVIPPPKNHLKLIS